MRLLLFSAVLGLILVGGSMLCLYKAYSDLEQKAPPAQPEAPEQEFTGDSIVLEPAGFFIIDTIERNVMWIGDTLIDLDTKLILAIRRPQLTGAGHAIAKIVPQ